MVHFKVCCCFWKRKNFSVLTEISHIVVFVNLFDERVNLFLFVLSISFGFRGNT